MLWFLLSDNRALARDWEKLVKWNCAGKKLEVQSLKRLFACYLSPLLSAWTECRKKTNWKFIFRENLWCCCTRKKIRRISQLSPELHSVSSQIIINGSLKLRHISHQIASKQIYTKDDEIYSADYSKLRSTYFISHNSPCDLCVCFSRQSNRKGSRRRRKKSVDAVDHLVFVKKRLRWQNVPLRRRE